MSSFLLLDFRWWLQGSSLLCHEWHCGKLHKCSVFASLQIFFFEGRFVFGPDVRSLGLTIFLIVAPVTIFCIFVARKLMDHYSHHLGIFIMAVAVVFTVYVSSLSNSHTAYLCKGILCFARKSAMLCQKELSLFVYIYVCVSLLVYVYVCACVYIYVVFECTALQWSVVFCYSTVGMLQMGMISFL